MKRREFCISSLQLGLLSLTSSLTTWGLPSKVWGDISTDATNTEPQFFIMFNMSGGWDTSLATDPWIQKTRLAESDYFIEYREDEVLPMGANFAGPALAPLKDYFDRLAIINGIFMSRTDGGHPSASLYAQTGNGQGHLGVLGSELETRIFNSPFGILANSSVYTAESRRMIWDLQSLLAAGKISDSGLLLDIHDKNSELSDARSAILNNIPKIKIFNQETALYGKPLTQGLAVASAFKSGLSSSVCIEISKGFDTHSSHPQNHLKLLIEAFTEIQQVLNVLKQTPAVGGQKALLDQTTVLIVSEFTRTPALNASQGKDHNSQCNSAIVLGPGIKPGVVGGSNVITRAQTQMANPYLVGMPLDVKTLQVVNRRNDAFILRPESVIATVAQSMNCNPGSISEGLGLAPLLKPILK